MKKLTLEAARVVASQTKAIIPLVRQREGEKVNFARLAVAIAEHAVGHAEEKDQPLAKEELRRSQIVLDQQLIEQPKRAADAVQHLKKLAHPIDKGTTPIRLPSRRLRRAAARLLAADARRVVVEERRISEIVDAYQSAFQNQVPGAAPGFVEVARVSQSTAPSSSKLLSKAMAVLKLSNVDFAPIPVLSRTGKQRIVWNLLVFKEKTEFALAQ